MSARLALIILSLLSGAAFAGSKGQLQLPEFAGLSAKASESVNVTFGPELLGFVAPDRLLLRWGSDPRSPEIEVGCTSCSVGATGPTTTIFPRKNPRGNLPERTRENETERTVPSYEAEQMGKRAPCGGNCGGDTLIYCSLYHGSYLKVEAGMFHGMSPNCACVRSK